MAIITITLDTNEYTSATIQSVLETLEQDRRAKFYQSELMKPHKDREVYLHGNREARNGYPIATAAEDMKK